MSVDLRQLLEDSAPEPSGAVDGKHLVARGRRRRQVKRLGAALGAVGVVVLTLALIRMSAPPQVPDIVERPEATPTVPERVAAPSDLPRPLVASVQGVVVELDPATGDVLREVGSGGEGDVRIALTPDATAVFHEELATGCATLLWRTPLDGGEVQELGGGLAPAVSDDGSTLAHVGYDPCVHDDHHLVIRDLDTDMRQTWPLEQPADELARIESLSWSADGGRLAVEVSYTARDGADVGDPQRYATHLVDLSRPPGPVNAFPAVDEADHTIEWRHPVFRGDRGTLLVIELCCDLDTSQNPAATAAQYRLLEIDPASGEVLDVLVESGMPITHVDADASGDHVLYVVDGGGVRSDDPGSEEGLFRYHGGESVRLAGTAVYADWHGGAVGTSTSTGPSSCGERPEPADVDGDGASDLVDHAYFDTGLPSREPQLRVCTAAGAEARLPGVGMAEELRIDDIEGDGRDEIFFGATTVSSIVGMLAVWYDDDLTVVAHEDGGELELHTGGAEGWDERAGTFRAFDDWGCEDVDGDGVRDLVTAHAERRGDVLDVRYIGYRIDGASAVAVWEDQRTIPVPDDPLTFSGLPECFR